MTAEDVKRVLGLVKHPREGGWYVRTWESAEFIAAEAFADGRYDGPRRMSTAIYYLLEPGTFSEVHLLESDEVFHHYLGDAVEMLQLFEDGSSSRVLIGKDIAAGETLQHVVQRGVWQGSRLLSSGSGLVSSGSGLVSSGSELLKAERWALLGCVVAPGFEFEDYSDASADELIAKWPGEAEMIRELTNR